MFCVFVREVFSHTSARLLGMASQKLFRSINLFAWCKLYTRGPRLFGCQLLCNLLLSWIGLVLLILLFISPLPTLLLFAIFFFIYSLCFYSAHSTLNFCCQNWRWNFKILFLSFAVVFSQNGANWPFSFRNRLQYIKKSHRNCIPINLLLNSSRLHFQIEIGKCARDFAFAAISSFFF